MEGARSQRSIPPTSIKRRHEVSRLEPDIMTSAYALVVPVAIHELTPQPDPALQPGSAPRRRTGTGGAIG